MTDSRESCKGERYDDRLFVANSGGHWYSKTGRSHTDRDTSTLLIGTVSKPHSRKSDQNRFPVYLTKQKWTFSPNSNIGFTRTKCWMISKKISQKISQLDKQTRAQVLKNVFVKVNTCHRSRGAHISNIGVLYTNEKYYFHK